MKLLEVQGARAPMPIAGDSTEYRICRQSVERKFNVPHTSGLGC